MATELGYVAFDYVWLDGILLPAAALRVAPLGSVRRRVATGRLSAVRDQPVGRTGKRRSDNMADCFPGEITIGGGVPASLLDEFLREVASTGGSVGGYEGAAFDRLDAEGLRQALDGDGSCNWRTPRRRFGQFEELEDFCVRHGIPFDRHSDAKQEYDSENVRFRPGMERPVVVSSDNCGRDLVEADGIRSVAKELARMATAGTTGDKLLAAVEKAGRKLDGLLPPEVEPLPPLEITDERG